MAYAQGPADKGRLGPGFGSRPPVGAGSGPRPPPGTEPAPDPRLVKASDGQQFLANGGPDPMAYHPSYRLRGPPDFRPARSVEISRSSLLSVEESLRKLTSLVGLQDILFTTLQKFLQDLAGNPFQEATQRSRTSSDPVPAELSSRVLPQPQTCNYCGGMKL